MQSESNQHRVRMQVRGIVQGVGFRPHVYRLARGAWVEWLGMQYLGRSGIEGQGTASQLEQFRAQLTSTLPELARLDSLHEQPIPLAPTEAAFEIHASQTTVGSTALVPTDLAPCSDCLREMFDASDRTLSLSVHQLHSMWTKFTIIHSLPYDRHALPCKPLRCCRLPG